ncbi:MAG: GGDEF domain-containing protein [Beijerinckiaceae bacterium]|nr:GGDEF domain-containing protein [Beijerinckiaceae bacterium]
MTLSRLPFEMGGVKGTPEAGGEPLPRGGAGQAVTYDWNLSTDQIVWGSGLAGVIDFAREQAFATGVAFAEHLAPGSASSRYEAIMAGGFDTGSGVPFQVIYGLVPYARSPAPPIWVEDRGRWFADGNGRPVRASGAIRVVTEAERARTAAAQRDPETGVFNQAYFEDQLARHLELSARKHTTFGVVLVELWTVGGAGQAVDAAMMQEVAARFARHMRAGEILARHGKTRLAILFENCNGRQLAIAATRLLESAGAVSMSNAMEPRSAGFRAGGVVAPLQGRTARDIVAFAAEALAIAEREGRTGFVPYDADAASKGVRADALLTAVL